MKMCQSGIGIMHISFSDSRTGRVHVMNSDTANPPPGRRCRSFPDGIGPRLLGALLCLFAAIALAGDPAQPEAASGWTAKEVAVGQRFMTVTAHPLATGAAVEILLAGGAAVDAAIAAQMVLNLVEPQSSGIGGGGFLLHHRASDGRVAAYDGRETAPGTARPDLFLGPGGAPMDFRDAVVGGRSVGVPGLLAMLAMAHAENGRLPWATLFGPAIRLAEAGFAVTPRLHGLIGRDPHLARDPAARRLFYTADGQPPAVGAILRNPELAGVFREIAREGPGTFYRGPIANEIVAAVRGHPRNPGDMTPSDLAGYRPRLREAVCGPYRGYRVCGMPPPSSGGVTVLQILGLLARHPDPGRGPLDPLAVHRFAEAGRLAYADRDCHLADPDFVRVPVEGLLDPAYLADRARLVDDHLSLDRAPAGRPRGLECGAEGRSPEPPSTTHLSIVDAEGNAVALTSSIESAFGSRVMVRGFLLNNQLTDFAFSPRQDGAPAANRVQAGKRPLSSMAPTLVFDDGGGLYAVLGSPGGSRIINYVAQALVALLDWRLPAGEVVSLPHYGSRNGPTELERGTAAETLAGPLEALGHRLHLGDMTSGLHLIVREGEHWTGAADPRREGVAVGL